jgi:hypothetical protein
MQLPELHAIEIDKVSVGVKYDSSIEEVATETVALAYLTGRVTLVLPFTKNGEYVTILVTSDSTVDGAIEAIFKSLESAPYGLRPHDCAQVLRPLH